MAKNIVGLDIGNRWIRAAEVKYPERAKPTMVRFHEVPLPEGAVNRGEVIEPRTVSTVIKQLWSDGGFSSKKVVLGMGNQRVLARDYSVPRMSLPRIRESLPYQVQDLLPVPVSEALLDFYPVSEAQSHGGPVVNGLLIAAVKDAVLGNVRAVEMAGLTTTAVDLIPFALTRSLAVPGQGDGTIAIVDIGATATSLVVATDGVPQFLRIIAAGGDDLTIALKQRLELGDEQADGVKRLMGMRTRVTDPAHEPAKDIINEVTGELLGSIRNTVSYFVTTRPDAPVERILLTGGAAALPGLPEALAELARLPVVQGDPYVSIGVSRSFTTEMLRQRQSSVTVALGLALGSAA